MNEICIEVGNGNLFLGIAILVVAFLIILVSVVSVIVSIVLGISYFKYNRTANSAGLTGIEAARKVLDAHGLQHIKVKAVGSILFGNSYSHYFKKVRLRRFTKSKKSLTSLAMGVEKAALAVMDKENDPDMKRRIRLVPLITFGPFAFIPLVIIGAILDFFVFNTNGWILIVLAALGFLFYIFSFILSLTTLKTEKKAQQRAYELLRENEMATEEEILLIKDLFKLYNIQYVNDAILSALEILYRILQIASAFSSSSSHSSSK